MTASEIRSELDRSPFIPFRLHLSSGKTVDVMNNGAAFLLRRSILVFHNPSRAEDPSYNVIDLRGIEMLEQLSIGRRRVERRGRHGS